MALPRAHRCRTRCPGPDGDRERTIAGLISCAGQLGLVQDTVRERRSARGGSQ